ncbi:hypothetical protein [Iningainema tapete]|uniref:Uncharacterized protein n=1 Tax=Iningainema tapete BLCC-T55 TaxID=2748662 RepID=A0A8J7BW66_9CYAN|nr:hypothetical protein [Iningainema tapete BLCC-T55]
MMTQYDRTQLETLKRNQLWEICSQLGLPKYAASVKCVEAILNSQPTLVAEVVATETDSESTLDAPMENFPQGQHTCASCPLFHPFNDGTGRGLCCGSDRVARDHHQQTQDCLHLIEEQTEKQQARLIEEQESEKSAKSATGEYPGGEFCPIPGYGFCISQGIEFKTRIGSETGTTYWYAVAPHYYNQSGREYKTGGFEKLENAVKAAIDYLGKCGVDVFEIKQQLINYLRYGTTQADLEVTQSQPLAEPRISFQSGELFFTPVSGSATTYEVKHWNLEIGEIAMNADLMWEVTGVNGIYRSPYEAAALLLELPEGKFSTGLNKKADSPVAASLIPKSDDLSRPIAENKPNPSFNGWQDTEVPEIEIDSTSDPDFGDLYRVWSGMNLLGTFYQGVSDKKWIAQIDGEAERYYCDTELEAQLLIIAKNGLLVADSPNDVDSVDSLLDKPVDELTSQEWQHLKRYYSTLELQAA